MDYMVMLEYIFHHHHPHHHHNQRTANDQHYVDYVVDEDR